MQTRRQSREAAARRRLEPEKEIDPEQSEKKFILGDDKPKKLSLWQQDGQAIVVLMFLYVLQGVPIGLAGSIPYMLTNRGVSYEQQALFSFTFLPFSLKLLWAPMEKF